MRISRHNAFDGKNTDRSKWPGLGPTHEGLRLYKSMFLMVGLYTLLVALPGREETRP